MRDLLGWWRGRRARRISYFGSCPVCGHDWREHPGGGFDNPVDDGCGECHYEVEHGERPADAVICHRAAPPLPDQSAHHGAGAVTSHEAGEPTARDLEVLALLQGRDGSLTDVGLSRGRVCRVWNIAWGYDAGDRWAHITTNVSPEVRGEEIDFFFTEEVKFIRAPDSGQTLLGPAAPSS